MSLLFAAEPWLSKATGGHPILVPALILAGFVIVLVLVVDFLAASFIYPALEKLGLRKRREAAKPSPSTTSMLADSDGRIVIVSPSGQCFVTLFSGRSKLGQSTQAPFGKAYKLQSDGQLRELWRVERWYSFRECFLSDDGRYLIRVVDSPGGSRVKDLAIAFYDRGHLLRQFFTSDLVTSQTNGVGWISRGRGFNEPNTQSAWPTFDLSTDNTFRLNTAEGISYAFDISTGEIIPADLFPEPGGVRVPKAIVVAGACVAAAGVGVLFALARRRLK